MNGIQKAIKAAGGQAALARKIDVTPQNIWNWLHTTGRVPPDKCQRVAAATGVSLHDLNPDIFPPKTPSLKVAS